MQRAGTKLLARAGFALQQHADIKRRDLMHQVADTIHAGLGRTHNALLPVESGLQYAAFLGERLFQRRGFDPELNAELFVLALQAEEFDCVAYLNRQLFGVPGLADELINAALVDGVDNVSGIGVAGDDDPYDLRPLVTHHRTELDTRHIRHTMIAEQDLNPFVLQNLLGFAGCAGGVNVKLFAENPRDGFQRTRFVIDHQNTGQTTEVARFHAVSRLKLVRCQCVVTCGAERMANQTRLSCRANPVVPIVHTFA